ncbi:MAG: bifunctional transcriptional activator/DNA repair protein Ada [Xanthomonadales bacterium]|nr:bifunctional transcriptional activator/DNA repair protein Ada [Xanthomonadales bacterium]
MVFASRLNFIANKSKGTFCSPGCRAAGAETESPGFESALEALAAGFRPCKVCRPLETGLADPSWIEALMAAVESDPGRRWHDHDLVKLGLDPAAVRRWFIANHGFTFHAYTRLRRLGQALRQIQHGRPVNQAVIAHGYDSESGFRESFSQVFGDPPSAVDRESSIWVNRIATPLGSMIMGVSDQGLCLLEFAERRMLDTQLKRLRQRMGRVFLPGDHPLMQQVKSELDGYFEGSLRKFSVPLQYPGTAFQEAVWDALQKIPYGELRSYGDIAERIGQPGAVRAVGRANGDNRIAIIIPCHRVVGADGELTGYGGGLRRKEYLLAMEQAQAFHLTS